MSENDYKGLIDLFAPHTNTVHITDYIMKLKMPFPGALSVLSSSTHLAHSVVTVNSSSVASIANSQPDLSTFV